MLSVTEDAVLDESVGDGCVDSQCLICLDGHEGKLTSSDLGEQSTV